MGKRIIFFSLFLLGPITLAFAAPFEGPTMPDKGNWKIGTSINQVKEQEIDYISGDAQTKDYFLNLSYGLTKYLCLDGKFGVGNVDYDRDIGESYHYDTAFSGGYGLRLKLYQEEQPVKFIIGAHHICVHPYSFDDSSKLKQQVVWDDWQIDSMMFKEFGKFIPYAGARVKRVFLIRKINNGERIRMKSDVEFGLALGFDYKITDQLILNIETRFIDEQGYSAGLSWLF